MPAATPYRLSVLAQQRPEAEFIVFCGVHFMAESADVLTADHQQVILPDLNAGCSMADMADLDEVEEAWDALARVTDIERLVPITYMNSSAALKAFVGRHGGAVCTSTNAARPRVGVRARRQGAVLPRSTPRPQHRPRHGLRRDDMRVWDPRHERGGLTEAECKEATFLLWKGHCSVHQRFQPKHIEAFRAEHPDGIVIAHPECSAELCELADQVGSTDYIIKAVENAPPGSTIAVGTEIHLVQRLANETPGGKTIVSLDPLICPCSTMFRIDGAHLCWVLENLVEGNGGQPDHGRRRHRRVGSSRAATHARHHGAFCPGLIGRRPRDPQIGRIRCRWLRRLSRRNDREAGSGVWRRWFHRRPPGETAQVRGLLGAGRRHQGA